MSNKIVHLYHEARNAALEERLQETEIAKLGERDGRKQAMRFIREQAGALDTEAALREIKARFADSLDGEVETSEVDSVSL